MTFKQNIKGSPSTIFSNRKNGAGFSLVEMIVYIALMSFIFIVIVNFLVVYGNGFESFKAASRINASAITSLERITREVKLASSVDSGASVLSSSPGKLVLNTTDGGSAVTAEIYLEDSAIKFKKNGILIGELTKKNVTIDSLVFYLSTSGTSELVKIEMNISTSVGTTTKTSIFLGSSVLRGSY